MIGARRAAAFTLLSALVGSSVASGVAAQPAPVGERCAIPGQIVVRDGWEHIRIPSFEAGPQSMTEYGVDPADPARLYATNGFSVAVSSDGGCRWRTTFRLDEPPAGADYSGDDSVITDLTVEPGHALLAISQRDGLRPHVVLSSYAGETWRRGDEGLRAATGRPLAVAMARSNPGYAFLLVDEGAGTGAARLSLGDRIYESTTAGGSWGERDAGTPDEGLLSTGLPPLREGAISGLAADPVEAGRLYVYGLDGLYVHQQGRRDQVFGDPVRLVAAIRSPGAPATTLLAAFEGTRYEVSPDGGASFVSVSAPGEVDSFAEALRAGDHYVSAGGRVYLRSNGRFTEVRGGAGVTSLAAARSQRQISPFAARSILTLYGRTNTSIVRREESRTIDLLPVPDYVVVDALGGFGVGDPEALPGSLTPDRRELVLREGQSRSVPYELVLPRTPTPLDVFFDVDTPNSMIPALDGLRDAMANIITELTAADIDAWFGVGQYKSFQAPPAFELMQDIAPPGQGLADALNRLRASDGGLETQLESLRQIATGEGGFGIAPGQDATWRKGSLRIVVNMTDEDISTGDNHPTYEEVGRVMQADDAIHFGIALQNEDTVGALGRPRDGLVEIAHHTKSFAPSAGVDCDGDDDPDLYQGEPLVCVIDHVRSRDAGVLGGAIISVLRSMTDVGEVSIKTAVDAKHPAAPGVAVPDEPLVTGVDFKVTNTIRFNVELTCPSVDEVTRFPIDVEAARESGVLASAAALLTCKPHPEPPAPVPPVIPPALIAAVVPPPPPPPPVNIGPHPNPHPNPQPNPNPQPQPQGQPQGAMATQRQTQVQLAVVQEREAAFAPSEARRSAAEEYALSSYTPPRAGPNQAMLGFAAALVIGFGTAMVALQRAEMRLAHQRSRRRRPPFSR